METFILRRILPSAMAAWAAFTPTLSSAQEVHQADVQLTRFIVGPWQQDLRVDIEVLSNNDDDAVNTVLYVFLPPESELLTIPSSCRALPSNQAFATCSLGQLGVGDAEPVTLTVSMPPTFVLPKFGAVAWSETPDPDFANNTGALLADGTLLEEASSAQVYVIFGGAKFEVPASALNSLYGGATNVRSVNDGHLAQYGAIPREGTLLREENAAEVWRIESGQKRHVTSPGVLMRYGGWDFVRVVPDGALTNIPQGAPIR